jgi:hypothetical protein
VLSDRHVVEPVQLQQPERLGVIARRYLDLVTGVSKAGDHRPEDHRVR